MQVHQELSSQSMWIKYDHSSLNPLSQTTHNLILSKNKIKTKTKFKLEKKCTYVGCLPPSARFNV